MIVFERENLLDTRSIASRTYECPCPLLYHLHSNNPNNMKPTITEDEFEDAEEENKFINEVCVKDEIQRLPSCSVVSCPAGVQDMVGKTSLVQVAS